MKIIKFILQNLLKIKGELKIPYWLFNKYYGSFVYCDYCKTNCWFLCKEVVLRYKKNKNGEDKYSYLHTLCDCKLNIKINKIDSLEERVKILEQKNKNKWVETQKG